MGARASARSRDPDRGVGDRLEGIRAGGDAGPHRQRGHHLLDRELRPHGHPHRRLDHRGAGTDADRQGIPARCATGPSPSSARSASTPAAATSSSRWTPPTGRMVVIEMNPRVSRSSALASKATGLPHRQDRRQAGRRLHAGRDPQRHHPRDPGQLRADHRLLRGQDPALDLREVSGGRRNAHHADEIVGEAMAIGRTFKEALQKAHPLDGDRRVWSGVAPRREPAGSRGRLQGSPGTASRSQVGSDLSPCGRPAAGDERGGDRDAHADRSVVSGEHPTDRPERKRASAAPRRNDRPCDDS